MKNNMKYTKFKFQSLMFLLAATLLLAACNNNDKGTTKEPVLENGVDTLSWVMGENIGLSVVDGLPFELDKDVFIRAIAHTLDGKQQPISDSAYAEIINIIMQSTIAMKQKQASDMRTQVDSAQQVYFARLVQENPNVKKHQSGFYYEVLKTGHGPKAQMAQRIRFDYRSFLMFTGEAYDQTYGRRESIIHVVGEPMFPGLIEGFQLMNAGSKYRFYFPYQLVSGERTSGTLQAYTPMIYEIELHELYKD